MARVGATVVAQAARFDLAAVKLGNTDDGVGGLRAPVSAIGWDGESPSRANVLPPEVDRNCAAVRSRGKQRETNCRSAPSANLIRPQDPMSRRRNGEVQNRAELGSRFR